MLEPVLKRRNKLEMVQFINDHFEYFEDALQLALRDEQPLSWRAAWMISATMKKNDLRIKPYIQEIIAVIPNLEDGHQRELFKILLTFDLEESFEGSLFDLSVNLWEQVRKQSSVRYFAFQGMVKVAEKYPELKNELLSLTQPHYINSLSPGIKKSVIKSLGEINS